MRKPRQQQREIGAAVRGQAIQRILVDGWSAAEVAQSLGIDERRVRRWVTDYRRHGMACLHGDLGAETMWVRWAAGLRSRVARLIMLAAGARRDTTPARCVELRSSADERQRL